MYTLGHLHDPVFLTGHKIFIINTPGHLLFINMLLIPYVKFEHKEVTPRR